VTGYSDPSAAPSVTGYSDPSAAPTAGNIV
jgi:hypothetical protein